MRGIARQQVELQLAVLAESRRNQSLLSSRPHASSAAASPSLPMCSPHSKHTISGPNRRAPEKSCRRADHCATANTTTVLTSSFFLDRSLRLSRLLTGLAVRVLHVLLLVRSLETATSSCIQELVSARSESVRKN